MLKYGALLFLVALLLAGCSSSPRVPPPGPEVSAAPPAPSGHPSDEVLFRAFSLIGTPYRYGGSSPDTGFDCSGLIHYVYREAGITLPRTTAGLFALQPSKPSATAPLQPGDLVLFAMSGRRVDHAGIYVGEGRFLHAPSSGGRVRVDSLHAGHWQRSYLGSRRVFD